MAEKFEHNLSVDVPLGELWQSTKTFMGSEDRVPDLRKSHYAGGLVLRSFEGERFSSAEDVRSRLKLSQQHFKQLAKLGLPVVPHVYEIAAVTDQYILETSHPSNYQDDALAYGASAFLPQATDLLPDQAAQTVAEPLRKYLEWCRTSEQPWILEDIYASRQYSVLAAGKSVLLHDIDPTIARVYGDTYDRLHGEIDVMGDGDA